MMQVQAMTYKPHLDGIRAIAVLAVVLYHARIPGFPGGFVGVDVFFVISGYLITGLLLRELELTGDISIRRFVERRVRRLAPALFVVLLVCLIAATAWMSPLGGEQQGLAKSAIATVLLSANLYFWRHTGSYFDSPADSFPLLHTWTLAVEEQFYLAWPWLMLAAGVWAQRASRAPAQGVLRLLVGITVLSAAACAVLTPRLPNETFFLTPFRAWEFSVGGLVLLLLRWQKLPSWVAGTTAWLGLAAVLASVAYFGDDMASPFPGWVAWLPVLGSAALIFGTEAHPGGWTARMLSVRPMVGLGLISYSLYLWHWPVLTMTPMAAIDEGHIVDNLLLCLVAVVLAVLTYRYVEQPIRSQQSGLMSSPRRTFRAGLGMVAGLLVLSLGLGAWAKTVWPRIPGNAELASRFGVATGVDWTCDADRKLKAPDGSDGGCLVGDKAAPVTVVLWGDSHAGHLKPALKALAASRGQAAVLRYMPSCPPALEFASTLPTREAKDCEEFNRRVVADITASRTIDTVVLSARWAEYAGQRDGERRLLESINRTVAELEKRDVRVIILAPGVEFKGRVRSCLVRRTSCTLERAEAQERRLAGMVVVNGVVAAFPRTVLVDPFDAFCATGYCQIRRGQIPMFKDSHHLSVEGAQQLAPALILAQQKALDFGNGRQP